MKRKLNRPWLTSSEVEIPIAKLKELSKSWDQSIWEAFLMWLDIGFRELLVRPETYEKLGSRQHETVFEIYGYESTPELKSLCDHLLEILTPEQKQILRKVYFDGKTVREIAFELNRSPSFVSKNKFKALSRLKVHKSVGLGNAQHTMRGAMSFDQAVNTVDQIIESTILKLKSTLLNPMIMTRALAA